MYFQFPFKEDFVFIVFTSLLLLYFFLLYDSLPCSLYSLLLKQYLSFLQLATFIDNKMEAYLSLHFETQEGFVKCDV